MFCSDGVTTKLVPVTSAKENAPAASVTALFETSPDRKTGTPARGDPPEVIVPRKVTSVGRSGSVGLPPLHAARMLMAAATAKRRTHRLVFMVRLPFAKFLSVLWI